MKKVLSLLMVCALTLTCMMSFTACGGSTVTAKVVDIDLTDELYAFGVDKDQPELLTQVNDFIAEIKADGTLDTIMNKYFGGEGELTPVTSAVPDASKDQLVVATNAAFEPFEYTDGDKYLGIDMEIAALLAKKLGKELVISNMDFDAVCLSVGQHKCDIAMAGLTVSEDRKEHVTFSESYYTASQRIIVPSNDTTFDACKTA
ncbi:MAG: transporter substrate-binding domain-containing protein, partial [Clostridia bacterium]|nr:transporter substrate-binding domain-containing protein [Clostridia bacterium]